MCPRDEHGLGDSGSIFIGLSGGLKQTKTEFEEGGDGNRIVGQNRSEFAVSYLALAFSG